MSSNKQYAQQLKEIEGYERDILAFKLCDEIPDNAAPYGDDQSFLCAIAAEVWEEGAKPFYITNENVICGGSVYGGLGMKRVEKEEFDAAMEMVIGEGKAYATREVFRSVNQKLPHLFHKHKYMVIGRLEDVENPDMVMIVADSVIALISAWLAARAWALSSRRANCIKKLLKRNCWKYFSRNLMQWPRKRNKQK